MYTDIRCHACKASCPEVFVEVENNDFVIDPVVAGVGGGIGALLGFIFGIIVIKYCLLRTIKHWTLCSKNNSVSRDNLDKSIVQNEEQTKQKTDRTAVIKSTKHKQKQRNNTIGDLSTDDESSKVIKIDPDRDCLVDILFLPSVEMMIRKLNKEKSHQLEQINVQSWHCRHDCMLQIFKLIAEEYLSNKQLSKKDYEDIYENSKKKFSSSLEIYHQQASTTTRNTDEFEVRSDIATGSKSKMGFMDVELTEKSKTMFASYLDVQKRFEDAVLECVGLKNASIIHEVLVKAFKIIEENVQLLQEYNIKVATDSFHRKVIVAQAFSSEFYAMKELMKKRRHYYEVILRRLSESDRLSEDESNAMWENLKDKVETKFDEVSLDYDDVVKKLHVQLEYHRRHVLAALEMQEEKTLSKCLSDSSLSSPTQRVLTYFEILMRLQQKRVKTVEDLNKNEIAEMSQLQKKTKSSLEIAYEEMQERFCESLASHGALSGKEAQVIMNELTKKNKKADEDVNTIIQIQNKIVERESKLNRSFQSVDSIDSKFHEDGKETRNQIMKEDLSDAKAFLAQQVHLDDEDQQAISREYKAFSMLLYIEEDLIRLRRQHELDAELLMMQIKVLHLEKQEERLASDEDVTDLVKRLDDARVDYERDNAESCMEGTRVSDSFLQLKRSFLCELAANALISSLLPEIEPRSKSARFINAIKDDVLSKVRACEQINEEKLQSLFNETREVTKLVEAQLRQEQDIQIQIAKERWLANQEIKLQKLRDELNVRPHSASSVSTAEVLNGLLSHERKKRSIEEAERSVEVTTMTQIYLQKLAFKQKLNTELKDLEKTLMCKVAFLAGMKRNDLLECVRMSMSRESASDAETKRLLSDFAKSWGNVCGFATQTINQQPPEDTRSDYGKPFSRPGLKPIKTRPKPSRVRRKNVLKRIVERNEETD